MQAEILLLQALAFLADRRYALLPDGNQMSFPQQTLLREALCLKARQWEARPDFWPCSCYALQINALQINALQINELTPSEFIENWRHST